VPQKRDYYAILEVDRSADEQALKKAFRRLAMQYHPDRNPAPEAKEHFQELQEAYEVLSDSEKRAIYDQFGHEGLKGRMGGSGRNMDDIFSGFSSIFEDFFGAAEARQRGQDLRFRLKVSFREAILGAEKEISVRRRESCGECSGSGAKKGSRAEECKTCQAAECKDG
jgi:molecular chaperone DnaJ